MLFFFASSFTPLSLGRLRLPRKGGGDTVIKRIDFFGFFGRQSFLVESYKMENNKKIRKKKIYLIGVFFTFFWSVILRRIKDKDNEKKDMKYKNT